MPRRKKDKITLDKWEAFLQDEHEPPEKQTPRKEETRKPTEVKVESKTEQERSWKKKRRHGDGYEVHMDTSWHPDELHKIGEDPSIVSVNIGNISHSQNRYERKWRSDKLDLTPLTKLPNLQHFSMSFDKVPKGLSVLADCSNLERIGINSRKKKVSNSMLLANWNKSRLYGYQLQTITLICGHLIHALLLKK